jgi:hypothetical protein
MDFRPLSNYLPDFTPRKSQELRIRELEHKNQELEMRLANAESWIDKLKSNYYRGQDE